ncbi:RNA-binding protein squid [Eurytemora carolleeae]|uniref:RNA-binding protein squid n=1 Tax=Eurytemora carolleeae TaxID=1294199 RepID=UPI000C75CB94|nr:RNA-binding protein squid [Eurytemora carolleeae]|eukprot:XP_023334541.1 RNA-binding protein squid-like [Eurytemora affinis]
MSMMGVDEEDRKLFCGGLPQECTQDDLKEYFGKYGELERVQLKMDPQTGRSRGFAFVLFKEVESLEAASQDEHSIKGKKATVKKADVKPGKIYLGKLPESGLSEDEIKTFLSEYGTVTEFIRPIDKMNGNAPKNFCFVTFDKERVSKKLIQQGNIVIQGHKLMIKEVTPNPRDPNSRGGMRGGARGGYGGGYGGGWGDQSAGYGGGWGADQGYGASAWGADASAGYGGGYGGGYGAADGGYGAAAGGYAGYGGGGMGGGKMRGAPRGGGGMGGGRGAPRGRGRGTPY